MKGGRGNKIQALPEKTTFQFCTLKTFPTISIKFWINVSVTKCKLKRVVFPVLHTLPLSLIPRHHFKKKNLLKKHLKKEKKKTASVCITTKPRTKNSSLGNEKFRESEIRKIFFGGKIGKLSGKVKDNMKRQKLFALSYKRI